YCSESAVDDYFARRLRCQAHTRAPGTASVTSASVVGSGTSETSVGGTTGSTFTCACAAMLPVLVASGGPGGVYGPTETVYLFNPSTFTRVVSPTNVLVMLALSRDSVPLSSPRNENLNVSPEAVSVKSRSSR